MEWFYPVFRKTIFTGQLFDIYWLVNRSIPHISLHHVTRFEPITAAHFDQRYNNTSRHSMNSQVYQIIPLPGRRSWVPCRQAVSRPEVRGKDRAVSWFSPRRRAECRETETFSDVHHCWGTDSAESDRGCSQCRWLHSASQSAAALRQSSTPADNTSCRFTPRFTIYHRTMLLGGSVVRALDSGPRGREFDSRRLRYQVTRSTQPSIPAG